MLLQLLTFQEKPEIQCVKNVCNFKKSGYYFDFLNLLCKPNKTQRQYQIQPQEDAVFHLIFQGSFQPSELPRDKSKIPILNINITQFEVA